MVVLIKVIGIVLFALVLLACFLRFLGYFIIKQTMGKRLERKKDREEPKPEDFPDIQEEKLDFQSGEHRLAGYLYSLKHQEEKPNACKGIVVVVHGHHLFHRDYLSEINFFVQHGYLVYAYDSTGSGESEGDCPGGQTQWVLDLHAALTMLEQTEPYEHQSIYLFGHSTGAYAVCGVLCFPHPQVKGVVSCAPINSAYEFGKVFWEIYPYPSWVTKQTYLAMRKYEASRFGKYSDYTVIKGVNSTDIPILIIHSKDDKVVPLNSSLIQHEKEITNPNAKVALLEQGNHFAFKDEKSCAYCMQRVQMQRKNGYGLNQKLMQKALQVFAG